MRYYTHVILEMDISSIPVAFHFRFALCFCCIFLLSRIFGEVFRCSSKRPGRHQTNKRNLTFIYKCILPYVVFFPLCVFRYVAAALNVSFLSYCGETPYEINIIRKKERQKHRCVVFCSIGRLQLKIHLVRAIFCCCCFTVLTGCRTRFTNDKLNITIFFETIHTNASA